MNTADIIIPENILACARKLLILDSLNCVCDPNARDSDANDSLESPINNMIFKLSLDPFHICLDLFNIPPDNTLETLADSVATETGKWPDEGFCRDSFYEQWLQRDINSDALTQANTFLIWLVNIIKEQRHDWEKCLRLPYLPKEIDKLPDPTTQQ